MEKRHIYSVDTEGNKREYEVILTFHNDNNEKDYVVYTNNEKDDEGKLKVYSAIYDPTKDEILGTPETREEWQQIIQLLNDVFK